MGLLRKMMHPRSEKVQGRPGTCQKARNHQGLKVTHGIEQEVAPRGPSGHTWNSVSIERNNAANRFYENTFSLFTDSGSTVTLQQRKLRVGDPSLQKMPTDKQRSERIGERASCTRE